MGGQHWPQQGGQRYGGEDRDIDLSMDMPVEASREELVTAYQEACARGDEIACACPSLSTMAKMGPGLA
jgi:hypothetical protein